jgi:hypothetical protein
VALSAQQGRVLQITQQLDAVRKEIDAATARSRAFEAKSAGISAELAVSDARARRESLERSAFPYGAADAVTPRSSAMLEALTVSLEVSGTRQF